MRSNSLMNPERVPVDQRQRLKTEAEKAADRAKQQQVVLSVDELRQQLIDESGYTADDFSSKPPVYIYIVGAGLVLASAILAFKL